MHSQRQRPGVFFDLCTCDMPVRETLEYTLGMRLQCSCRDVRPEYVRLELGHHRRIVQGLQILPPSDSLPQWSHDGVNQCIGSQLHVCYTSSQTELD